MPTILFRKKEFDKALGKKLPLEKIVEELEQIKVEVSGMNDAGIVTAEVTGDRPDLMSGRGIARALAGKLGIAKGVPKIEVGKPALKIIAEKEALKTRPVIVGAIVEGCSFDEETVAEIFQLQEKLDFVIGRKRKRVSIGLYDLDALTPPFKFTTISGSTSFHPLKAEGRMTVEQILKEHPTGSEYASLLSKCNGKYPALVDSKGEVLSLIPIINGISSAVTAKTKRVFIDHTGSHESACNASLAALCQEFYDAGCKVSKVSIEYPNGEKQTPMLEAEKMRVSVAEANKMLGTSFTGREIVSFLEKQRINARVEEDWVACEIPCFRADFLHPVDLIEEIAIGYGYNNFEPKAPNIYTKGSFSQLTLLENACRDFMLGAGFTEVCSYIITSEDETEKAREEGEQAEILNPVSEEYAVMRNSLLPGLLDALSKNTHLPYPQKLFEAGEVIVPNAKLPERMQTQTRLACISSSGETNLTEVASVLAQFAKLNGKKMFLKKLSSKQFIEGRAAEIVFDGKTVGRMGEIHPSVLEAFGIGMPCSAFEITLA